MSEVQNNLGEKFKETIAEAMKTGDFHALNTLVTDTVNDALREADFQANLSRQNGSNGKNSRRSAAGRTKNGTGSAESGKSSGKNNGRLRQSRTVHGIRHSR